MVLIHPRDYDPRLLQKHKMNTAFKMHENVFLWKIPLGLDFDLEEIFLWKRWWTMLVYDSGNGLETWASSILKFWKNHILMMKMHFDRWRRICTTWFHRCVVQDKWRVFMKLGLVCMRCGLWNEHFCVFEPENTFWSCFVSLETLFSMKIWIWPWQLWHNVYMGLILVSNAKCMKMHFYVKMAQWWWNVCPR